MDLTETIVPKSDQLNAEDLLTGPRTFTVADVKKGSAEQPVDIHLVEFPGRPFRPSKTVRRILVNAWGPDAATYAGRRMTLYRDPAVKFGGMDVGGIRVSHLSHIDKPLSVALTVSRGKRQPYTVQPLPSADRVAVAVDQDEKYHGEPPASAKQKGMYRALVGEKLPGISRDDLLAMVTGVIGHAVESSNDLTMSEMGKVIDHLDGLEATS